MSIIAQMESFAACSTSAPERPEATAASFALAATFSIDMRVGSRPALTSSSSIKGQLSRAQLGPGSRSPNVSTSFSLPISLDESARALEYSSALQKCRQSRSELRWARADSYSSRFHRLDLAFGAALAPRDDRPGMAHPAARRRGPAGDKADSGFGAAVPGLVGEELGGLLLGASADLA